MKRRILDFLKRDACQVLAQPIPDLVGLAREYQANKAAYDFWAMIEKNGLEYAESAPVQPWKELALLATRTA